jgi:hypothetical protein
MFHFTREVWSWQKEYCRSTWFWKGGFPASWHRHKTVNTTFHISNWITEGNSLSQLNIWYQILSFKTAEIRAHHEDIEPVLSKLPSNKTYLPQIHFNSTISHYLPSYWPSPKRVFPSKIRYAFLACPIWSVYLGHYSFLGLTRLNELYTSQSSSSCILMPPVSHIPLLDPNIFSSTLHSETFTQSKETTVHNHTNQEKC